MFAWSGFLLYPTDVVAFMGRIRNATIVRSSHLLCSNSTTKFNILWNSLSYPNVLNFVGIAGNTKWYQFTTVSEWVVHGYTGKNATNRLELVGVSGFQWFPINPSNSCVVQWKG